MPDMYWTLTFFWGVPCFYMKFQTFRHVFAVTTMPAQAPGVDHLENTNLCPKQQQQQVIKVTPSYHIKLATYLKKTNKKDLI